MEPLNGSILGLVTSLVLVVVLVLKEILRVWGGPMRDVRMRVLTILAVPLLAVFGIILVFQVLHFLE